MATLFRAVCLTSLLLSLCFDALPREVLRPVAPALGPARTAAGETRAQDSSHQDFRLKVNVDLVTVDVSVYGSPVRELRKEDFLIYDNGVAQQAIFLSRDQLPLSVALVVDRSPSIAPYLRQLQSAALSALKSLKTGDQAVLFAFDRDPARLSDLTQDFSVIAEKIGRIDIGQATNISDSIYDAAYYLREQAVNRRRAIILVSDNYQTVISAHTWSGALQEALEAGATLYSVETPGDQRGQFGESPDQVHTIARQTGGQVLEAGGSAALAKALDQTMSNLRLQYTIGFTPSDRGIEGTFHPLFVNLKTEDLCSDCKVQARRGYYAGVRSAFSFSGPDHASGSGAGLVEPFANKRLRAAAADPAEFKGVPFKVQTAPASDPGITPQIKVDLEIDASRVGFPTVDGRHTARVHVAVFYADPDGIYLGCDWKVMDLRLDETQYREILKTGIFFSTKISLIVPKQILKVIVYDPTTNRIGSHLVKLRQPAVEHQENVLGGKAKAAGSQLVSVAKLSSEIS